MAKEIMIVTPEDIKNHITLSSAAADTLKWMIENAGVEMDEQQQAEFIQQRALRANEIRENWELKAWCEKSAASIKEAVKHTMNVGTEDELPPNVSWNKQSFTYEFTDGAAELVAQTLLDRGLVSIVQLLQQLTVSQVSKASGMTVEKLTELVPDTILQKPKERTLKIK